MVKNEFWTQHEALATHRTHALYTTATPLDITMERTLEVVTYIMALAMDVVGLLRACVKATGVR